MRLGFSKMRAGKKVGSTSVQTIVRAFGVFLLISAVWAVQSAPAVAQNFKFNRVVVEGNARIGDSAVISQSGIAQGQTVSAGQLNDAYQRLQNSGLFESVEMAPAGNTLRITVVEFPTINRVSFEGNRRIKDEAMSALVTSAERRVFNPSVVEADAAAIAEAYTNDGRLAARVTPRIIKRSNNRVDVVFEIFEGDVVEIERLSFVGNRIYSDNRLRRVLDTKQAGLFRALVRKDTFVEDRIEFDKQILQDFYLSRGYIDFRTNSVNAQLAQERDGYFLAFNIQEGQQFKFGEITTVSNINSVDSDDYQDVIRVRPGVVYSPTLVEQEIARMERLAVKQGVDFLRVEPRIKRNDRDLTLDVEFVLSRGPREFVERIDIEGNTTTLDQVIRRQFDSVEGDPLNPREIREAAERIRALDFFSSSQVNAREGSAPDQVIVDVDVVEQPTGALSFGGSFSATDGFGLAISFVEKNFVGRGQQLSLDFSTAEESESYGFRFAEPAFLGRNVEFAIALSYSETDSDYATYDTEQIFFRPSLSFPIAENARLQLRYTAERIDVLERDTSVNGTIIASDIAAGPQISSALGYQYTYDTRTTGIDTDRGFLFQFGQDFAGVGGDSEYIKTTAKAIAQRKIFNEEVTLRATLEAGGLSWVSGTNRAADRFIISSQTFRGFETGGIGPRDGVKGDALGGNLFVVARFEAEFPLGLPEEYGITGALFYDVANLWDLSDVNTGGTAVDGESGAFRHVIGFGILWETPVGPLRFNFTEAIKKEDYDIEQTFDLTLTTKF
ncbi:outer membrane protein assembly factor BamA [Pseudosulfitobacter sp. SM2401]|uniref:outer membrane protein assembly factor BamA n=1 Tax=Pseudosulfitobacter sp. SM2401 TaxID=3350098 RepID=UPI0036F2A608